MESCSDDDMSYYCSDEEGSCEDYDNAGAQDDDDLESAAIALKLSYIVLHEDDLRRRQDDVTSRVSEVLSIPQGSAFVLLRQYNWNANMLEEEWFVDEEGVRGIVGLPENGVCTELNSGPLTCAICFETYSVAEMSSAGCSHYYCRECWQGYIHAALGGGPRCLSLQCPEPSCSSTVVREMVNTVASDKDKDRYARFALRSYIEDSKNLKWCPAPGCECAVEFLGGGNYDVTCYCKHGFCWKCGEEAHRPVDCETVANWLKKHRSDSASMKWLLKNTKPCPLCKRHIEKNAGCMHITCTCRCEFCWLCLGPWKNHQERTGGFYHCNRYSQAKADGSLTEEDERRERAKASNNRYLHYYERWATNEKSRQKAQADLDAMEESGLEMLSATVELPVTDLAFVTKAWERIVDCRRVLRWTYAYGYYLEPEATARRELFEYLQAEAEAALERLHHCVEQELEDFKFPEYQDYYAEKGTSTEEFAVFRMKLAGLTDVTGNYFDNFVKAFETGLAEVLQ